MSLDADGITPATMSIVACRLPFVGLVLALAWLNKRMFAPTLLVTKSVWMHHPVQYVKQNNTTLYIPYNSCNI
jgi:stringent starvation protein B